MLLYDLFLFDLLSEIKGLACQEEIKDIAPCGHFENANGNELHIPFDLGLDDLSFLKLVGAD